MINKFSSALIVILLSGLGFYFSAPFHNIWFLIWLAPIPLLIYIYKNRFLPSLLVSFLVSLAPGINTLVGYWPTTIPKMIFISQGIYQAIAWTLIFLLTRFLVRKNPSVLSIFIFPCLMSLLEWGLSLTNQGTFGSISYSQLYFLPTLQIAAFTGFIGITFTIALFSSGIAYAISFYQQRNRTISALIITLLLVGISIGIGIYRIHFQSQSIHTSIKIGLAATDPAIKDIFNPTLAEKNVTAYAIPVQQLAKQGVNLVVLPEEIAAVNATNRAKIMNYFSSLAKKNHVMIIVGINETINTQRFNSAWLFDDTGKLIGEYSKRHFVPVLEASLTPGVNLLNFSLAGQTAGIAICRDMDYPDPAHQYGENHTRILFVPAWDFMVDAKVHAMGAFMRTIENGYTLVRSSRAGLLSVTDVTGKTNFIQTLPAQTTILSITAPIANADSFYSQHGDWFAWVLIVLLGLSLAQTLFFKR